MVASVLWWKRDEYLQGGPCGQYVPQACRAYFHYSQPTFGGFEPIETWTAAVASQKCTHQQWTGPFTTRLLPPTLVPTPFVRYRNVFLPVIATKYLDSLTARSLRLASMGLYLCVWACLSLPLCEKSRLHSAKFSIQPQLGQQPFPLCPRNREIDDRDLNELLRCSKGHARWGNAVLLGSDAGQL